MHFLILLTSEGDNERHGWLGMQRKVGRGKQVGNYKKELGWGGHHLDHRSPQSWAWDFKDME